MLGWELTRYSPPRLRARPAQAHRPDCVPYSARSAQARLRLAFTRSGHTSNLSPSHSQVAGPGSALCAGSRHSPSPLVCLPHHSRRCAPFADLTGLGYSAGASLTLAHAALPRIPLRSVVLACYPALTSPLAPSRPGPARSESARPGSGRLGPSRPVTARTHNRPHAQPLASYSQVAGPGSAFPAGLFLPPLAARFPQCLASVPHSAVRTHGLLGPGWPGL